VIQMAREITGHPIPAEVIARRPGDPDILIASSDAIRRDLGWSPRYTELRAIVESAWAWHQSHPDGYAD
jgi:UDP-glucose 4-epimerase